MNVSVQPDAHGNSELCKPHMRIDGLQLFLLLLYIYIYVYIYISVYIYIYTHIYYIYIYMYIHILNILYVYYTIHIITAAYWGPLTNSQFPSGSHGPLRSWTGLGDDRRMVVSAPNHVWLVVYHGIPTHLKNKKIFETTNQMCFSCFLKTNTIKHRKSQCFFHLTITN